MPPTGSCPSMMVPPLHPPHHQISVGNIFLDFYCFIMDIQILTDAHESLASLLPQTLQFQAVGLGVKPSVQLIESEIHWLTSFKLLYLFVREEDTFHTVCHSRFQCECVCMREKLRYELSVCQHESLTTRKTTGSEGGSDTSLTHAPPPTAHEFFWFSSCSSATVCMCTLLTTYLSIFTDQSLQITVTFLSGEIFPSWNCRMYILFGSLLMSVQCVQHFYPLMRRKSTQHNISSSGLVIGVRLACPRVVVA